MAHASTVPSAGRYSFKDPDTTTSGKHGARTAERGTVERRVARGHAASSSRARMFSLVGGSLRFRLCAPSIPLILDR